MDHLFSHYFSYVAETPRWAPKGVTVAGGHRKGHALNQLNCPLAHFVHEEDTIVIADWGNARIVEWKCGMTTSGRVLAGGNGEGNRLDQFSCPTDVIVDKMNNNESFIVGDYENRRVMRYSRRSDTRCGEIIVNDTDCSGLAMDDEGSLYVTDVRKHEVKRYRQGETTGIVVAGGNGQGDRLNQLSEPRYVCVDKDQTVYVADKGNHRVIKWMKNANEGIVVAGGRGEGHDLTQLSDPQGVLVDARGTLYVADTGNRRVMRWCHKATHGTVVLGGIGKGNASDQFNSPIVLSLDRHGHLYVADGRNHRVQRFALRQN